MHKIKIDYEATSWPWVYTDIAAGSGDKKSTIVQKNSILELNLDREIADVVVDNPLKNFSVFNPSISQNEQIGLFELQKTIEKAKEDKNIKVVLKPWIQ